MSAQPQRYTVLIDPRGRVFGAEEGESVVENMRRIRAGLPELGAIVCSSCGERDVVAGGLGVTVEQVREACEHGRCHRCGGRGTFRPAMEVGHG